MEIPRVGLGTYQSTDAQKLEAALIYAVEECGYRYIDTAQAYMNEQVIGAALQKVFAKGAIKRSDIWITTKLWVTCRRPHLVEPAIRESLAKLQTDYIDLYLVHTPAAIPPQPDGNIFPRGPDGVLLSEHVDILDTWAAMEPLVEKGLTRHIGVSNFSIEMLERMELSPRVKIQPFANQVEQSLYCQQWAMIQYLAPRGIKLTAWSQFSHGEVGPAGVPLLQDPVLLAVAAEVGRTPGQVAMKYLLQLSPIINVIPKSLTLERIRENFGVDGFELKAEQISKLRKLNVNFRIANGVEFFGYDLWSQGI
jgi:diketogulonate reductase-like aldo/keto reductase